MLGGWGPRLVVDDETRRDIVDTFKAYDTGGKGYLIRAELKLAMIALLGFKPTKIELDRILPKNEDGRSVGVPQELFERIMADRLALQDRDIEIRQIFEAMDVGRRGFITAEDLKRVFKSVASSIPESAIAEAFAEVDTDMDGRVGYRDFERMMKCRVS
eukprot:tig00000147_g9486.t1